MSLTTSPPIQFDGDLPEQGAWTYEAYCDLPDTGWLYEIMEGELFMAPAPHPQHQRASNVISSDMSWFVRDHDLGQVYYAPIDVFLPVENTNVQPDILFLAKDRLHLISDRGIEGAPDLVIEILSPGNWIVDRQNKYALYEKTGVQEYWIVDVKQKTIEIFTLTSARYELQGKYTAGQTAPSHLLDGFSIAVDAVCG